MKVSSWLSIVVMATVLVVGSVSAVVAQSGPGAVRADPGRPVSERPNLLEEIAFDQKLDARVPGDLIFRDAHGRSVQLSDYFGRRPIVLALVYYECPMLCTQVLSGLVSALGTLNLDAGKDFDVVAVSFNPREGPGLAEGKKQAFVERYKRAGTEHGLHFLTGPEASIAQLTRAVGFRYKWHDDIQQYAHAVGLVVLTPAGRVSKYYYGIEYSPRDLRLGLVEASGGNIGSRVDQLLLYCYHYDPATGKYGFAAMAAVRAGGALTVLGMVCFWVVMWRQHAASQRELRI
jgi:protein SCO1/2